MNIYLSIYLLGSRLILEKACFYRRNHCNICKKRGGGFQLKAIFGAFSALLCCFALLVLPTSNKNNSLTEQPLPLREDFRQISKCTCWWINDEKTSSYTGSLSGKGSKRKLKPLWCNFQDNYLAHFISLPIPRYFFVHPFYRRKRFGKEFDFGGRKRKKYSRHSWKGVGKALFCSRCWVFLRDGVCITG